VEIEFRDGKADEGDGDELLNAMRGEIAIVYDGLDLDSAKMPRAGAADLGPPGGAFLVGYADGRAVCVGGIKRLDERRCELKRMYVVPEARGQGVARALLHALEDRARGLDYEIARLDTGPRQPHAEALYRSEGYAEIHNFNDNPIASYWGEKPL
jgi:GNAT superfamily N-acetyltransferase